MAEQNAEQREAQLQVRGCVITARLSYVAKTHGDDKKSIILNRLGTSDRKRIENVAADGDWFDYSLLETVERAIVDTVGGRDESYVKTLGRASADYNLKRILAVRTSGLGPELLLQRLCKMPLFDNFGEGEYETLDASPRIGVALTYDYPPAVSESFIAGACGFYERLVERLGGANVIVTPQRAEGRGPNAVRYDIRWELGSAEDPEEGSGALTEEEIELSAAQLKELEAERNAQDPLGRMFREAVAPATPAVAAPVAKKKGKVAIPPFLRNVKLVGGISLVLFALVALEIAWMTGYFTPSHRGYIGGHTFTRTGDLDLVVALDHRMLLLEPGHTIHNVRVDAHVGTSVYSTTYPVLPGSALVHVDLSQFRAATGAHPPTSELPTKIVVEALVSGRKVIGEFRP